MTSKSPIPAKRKWLVHRDLGLELQNDIGSICVKLTPAEAFDLIAMLAYAAGEELRRTPTVFVQAAS